ncbi:MAG TPA: hypothetical protein VGO34_00825 [Alphaproteobacteria bacterium]|jgi:hypothetical protein
MIGNMSLSVAVLAGGLIAGSAMAQTAPRPATPLVNPSAYAAIAPVRAQWEQARAAYLQAQQAELAARANLDRMTTALLNVLSSATGQPQAPAMPVVGLLAPLAQPAAPALRPQRPPAGPTTGPTPPTRPSAPTLPPQP